VSCNSKTLPEIVALFPDVSVTTLCHSSYFQVFTQLFVFSVPRAAILCIHPTLTLVLPYWLSSHHTFCYPAVLFRIYVIGFLSYSDTWPVRIHCPETSINNYHTTPRNTPEDRRFRQHRGGSLKSRLFTYSSLSIRMFYIHSSDFFRRFPTSLPLPLHSDFVRYGNLFLYYFLVKLQAWCDFINFLHLSGKKKLNVRNGLGRFV
jgi:hypothetical protein